jgi:hypothetical protein
MWNSIFLTVGKIRVFFRGRSFPRLTPEIVSRPFYPQKILQLANYPDGPSQAINLMRWFISPWSTKKGELNVQPSFLAQCYCGNQSQRGVRSFAEIGKWRSAIMREHWQLSHCKSILLLLRCSSSRFNAPWDANLVMAPLFRDLLCLFTVVLSAPKAPIERRIIYTFQVALFSNHDFLPRSQESRART